MTAYDPDLLRRAYEEILEPSFPPDELETLESLAGRMAAGDPSTFGAVALADGAPVGVMIADCFPASRVLLLSYLAVHPGQRGGRIGSTLLNDVLPTWRERADAVVSVAEVEDPRFHPAGPHGDPVKRLRFYARAGFRLLPSPFVQPRVRPGADRVGGMLLLAAAGAETLPRQTLRGFVSEYYTDSEEADESVDTAYAGLLARVDREPDPLVLLPPEQYAEVPPLRVTGELLRRDYPGTAVAARLLAVDERGVALLDEVWEQVLARMAAGEELPRPRRTVVAEFLDRLSGAGLVFVSPDPGDASVLADWFAGDADPWAGWWRETPPSWGAGVLAPERVERAIRRLPPLPRLLLLLSDVVGLTLPEATEVAGQAPEHYLAILEAARMEVVSFLDHGAR
ncbi:GNAT family N-acetyltransferase [Plantactinospora sp. WMMB334]|uniref:GNAT family N-acetyltransferase n=1 Tax=Plantactinospora sp. WMMB334 TaxID=3404119 RepID=UPI003B951672